MAKTHHRSRIQDQLVKGLIALGVPTGNTILLTTPGRRTGQPRSTPVMVIQNGGRWIVAPYGEAGWVQNIRVSGRARSGAHGKSEDVRVRELPPGEAAPVIKTYLEKYGASHPPLTPRRGTRWNASQPKRQGIRRSR